MMLLNPIRKLRSVVGRLKHQSQIGTATTWRLLCCHRQWSKATSADYLRLRERTLGYVAHNKVGNVAGAYSYVPGGPALLYASCYAALTRHLLGDLQRIPDEERVAWCNYIQGFQQSDGLFRDPVVDNPLACQGDSWGYRHLTLHCIMALAALGGRAHKTFQLIEPFKEEGYMSRWLESREWNRDAAEVSNEIQNRATLLQYARDFQSQDGFNGALNEMYRWLNQRQDPITGLWGGPFDTPHRLSQGVQTGYHLWTSYLRDGQPVQYIERIVDSCLKTQNALGGFGVPVNSSACEDMDSIFPLAWLSRLTRYRNMDVRSEAARALRWMMINVNDDGGWVFRRGEGFQYGHELMSVTQNQSSMFPTWFRMLGLAYLAQLLPDHPIGRLPWHFLDAPGLQFWNARPRN